MKCIENSVINKFNFLFIKKTWADVHKFKEPRTFIEVVDLNLRLLRAVALKPCIIEFKAPILAAVKLDVDP